MLDALWFPGEDHPAPPEWHEFVLHNQVYPGLDPRVVDELDSDIVQSDLICWSSLQSFLNRNRGK